MPKLNIAIPNVSIPTVLGGSDNMKLKPKNVQIKVKAGSNSCLIFRQSIIVDAAYNMPRNTKKTPMNLWSNTSRIRW